MHCSLFNSNLMTFHLPSYSWWIMFLCVLHTLHKNMYLTCMWEIHVKASCSGSSVSTLCAVGSSLLKQRIKNLLWPSVYVEYEICSVNSVADVWAGQILWGALLRQSTVECSSCSLTLCVCVCALFLCQSTHNERHYDWSQRYGAGSLHRSIKQDVVVAAVDRLMYI